MRKALTSLASILSAVLAVCWGSANAQNITLEIVTDLWGYEAYWEMTPVGDPCGTNTLFSGGNTVVGCAGGGLQAATAGDPGAYASSSTIPLGSVGTAPASFNFTIVDDFGDGGNTYNFYVDGNLQATYTHTQVFPNATSETFLVNLVAGIPGCTSIEAVNFDPAATVDNGSCLIPSCNAGSGVAPVPSQTGSYCYDNSEVTGFTIIADAGETATLLFTGGTVEALFDFITVYDGNSNAFPVLGSFDGPAAGQAFQSTGTDLYFELVTDGSFSCVGGQIPGPLTWNVYCASAVPGCTDADALNFDPAATVDDGTCAIIPCDVDDATPPVADGQITYCYGPSALQGFGFSSTNPGVDNPSIFIVQGNFEVGFDTFTVYDGADNTAPVLASGDGNFAGQLFTASGDDLYIEITSDTSVSCTTSIALVDLIVDYYCATAIVPGCTDMTATNYNPDATIDDGSCVYPPANNDCANAIAVQCGDLVTGTTTNSTDTEGFIGGAGCGAPITSPGVWYVFNGTGDLVTLTTCANTFDTRVSVFTGSCGGGLVCETGADDGNTTPGCATFSTQFSFPSTAGEIYYIYVHGFGTQTGDFDLEISCQPDPCLGYPVAGNDDCSAAQLFLNGFTFTADLCCTTGEGNVAQQCSFNQTQGVWYVFDNSLNFDDIFFDVINLGPSGSFIGLSVYLATDNLDPCNSLQILGCCTDFAGQCQGSMQLIPGATPLVPGGLYFFNLWTSTPDNCGQASIQATGLINGCTDQAANNYDPLATQDDGSCDYTGVVPANDLCGGAIVMNCGDVLLGQSTGGATATGAPACGAAFPGVWYQWTGTGDFATVSTCGSDIDSYLRVLSGPCGGPYVCEAFEDDDIGSCGFFDADDASISFFSAPGTNYFFYVSGFGGQQGTFGISLECAPVTPGCTDATAENYDPAANVDDGSCNYTWANACGGNYEICYDNLASQAYTYCTPNVGTDAVIVTFGSNSVVEAGFDILNIYDGSDNTGTLLFSGDGDVSGLSFGAASGCLTIEIISDASVNCADGVFVLGVNFDITCEALVFGCTNDTANNYDPAANVDDGSCDFCNTQFAYCYGSSENYVQTFNAAPGESVQIDIVQGIVEAGFDIFTVYDGPNTASPILFSGDGDVSGQQFLSSGNSLTIQIVSDFSFSCAEGNIGLNTTLLIDVLCGLAGCDNPIACNFDPAAIFLSCDLCEYSTCLGCTYPDATNYDMNAGLDDGSCVFDCVSDCPADLNNDNIVNTGDLVILLSAFGTTCP